MCVCAGGFSGGCWLAAFTEGRRLASLPEHFPGLVRHGSCSRPVQRRCHGPAHLRHHAFRMRAEIERIVVRWLGRRGEKKFIDQEMVR